MSSAIGEPLYIADGWQMSSTIGEPLYIAVGCQMSSAIGEPLYIVDGCSCLTNVLCYRGTSVNCCLAKNCIRNIID